MSVLKADGLAKAFGVETLFEGVSFEIRRGEKVGLIGANGTGKTTLMRCLLGFEQADAGQVSLTSGETVGYVEQGTDFSQPTLAQELTLAYQDVLSWQEELRRLEAAIAAEKDEAALAALMKSYANVLERFERGGGYEYENNIRKVAFGLGFSPEDLERDPAIFSGGQKTRVSLAKALIRQPDFLFLDEPTNHLDIAMVEWLEEFLTGYSGGVIIISHDRYFLDKVAGRIFELENNVLTPYSGNYTQYLAQKAERLEALLSAYEKQQALIARTQEFIDRYRAGVKARQARGREKRLERLERMRAPGEAVAFRFALEALSESAERVAVLEEVKVAYGERVIFEKLSLLIRRGDGVALVGPNGAGKTTLLKLLTGELEAVAGRAKLGSRVRVGYFSQEHEGLNKAQRVLDEMMREFGLGEERARNFLGGFLFRGDDVYKVIGELSGGEQARLSLLKLMLSGANFLILDEPTNHLDIPAKEAVEDAILQYPGTFLAVSHDRYFLDKVADRIVELEDGKLTEYAGNYSYYREKKAARQKQEAAAMAVAVKEAETIKKVGKPRQRKQDSERVLKKLEARIAELEAQVALLEQQLNDPASHSDPQASRELAEEYAAAQAALDAKYSEWLELTSEEA